MDVQLITSSVLGLPSSQRVDAIVHDGATDLRTWPGPGPDRDLVEHYGSELGAVLDRERERLPGRALPIGGTLRLHRGKLHCDFLLWVATRPPEQKGVAAKAPSAEVIERAVIDALAFASSRHVARMAFGALGAGPDALDDVERIVVIGRAANAYHETAFSTGRAAGIEEVLICHPHSSKISAARRELGHAVKLVEEAKRAPEPPSRTTHRRSASARKPSTRRSSAKAAVPVLSTAEVANARATAGPYDRAKTYEQGQYMVHSRFGVGRIESITREGFIIVLFGNGETRCLLHNRP